MRARLTLALLHGFAGGPEHWDLVVASLARGLRPAFDLQRPRLPGHDGLDPGPATFLEQATRVRDALGVITEAPLVLAGYSLGARFALALAALDWVPVARLVLIGVHPGLDEPSARAERRALDERRAQDLTQLGLGAFLESWDSQALFAERLALSATAADCLQRARAPLTARGLAGSLRAAGLAAMPSFWERPPRCSTVVVAGARDARGAAVATAYVPRLPRGRLEIVEDGGHDLLLSHPERIAGLLRGALRDLEGLRVHG